MSLERAHPWHCCGGLSALKQSQVCDHSGDDARYHHGLCGEISRPLSCSPNFGSPLLVLETPLSLSQLCRVTVRKAAGQRALEKIAKLDIPPRLIQYLSYN